jgi:hypothetical protein
MNDKPTKSKHDIEAGPPRPSGKLNPAFDTWLETKLHKIFDSVASEPLPQDLMNLLGKIDEADAKKKP